MNEIIGALGNLAKEAGPAGIIFAVGCSAVIILASTLSNKDQSAA